MAGQAKAQKGVFMDSQEAQEAFYCFIFIGIALKVRPQQAC